MSESGSWSEYIADAGTDPLLLDEATLDMSDAATGTVDAIDSIDTSALPDAAVESLEDARSDATDAGSWADWSQGELDEADSWRDTAADHEAAAAQFLADGNTDAYEQEMDAAETANGFASENDAEASTYASFGADDMDSASASIDTAAAVSADA